MDLCGEPFRLGFRGLEIIEDEKVGEPLSIQVPRSWRERLLSRPWRPWRRTKPVTIWEPKGTVFQLGNKLIMHPADAHKLRTEIVVKHNGKVVGF
jgi:hypothetical protein